jgi:4-amino-4-deoxy-L-arabinose transferase-like glycosyltransferase
VRAPSRPDRLFALLFVAVALARTALLVSSQHIANGDESAIGVMAVRILQGERPIHPSVADRHGGSALAGYLTAVAFSATGASEHALKLPPLLISLAALAGVYVLVRATRGPEAGLLAAGLFALHPGLAKWSFYAPGGYVLCQALFLAVHWLALARCCVAGRARPHHDLLLGLGSAIGTAVLALFAPAAASSGLLLLAFGASGPIRARLGRFALGFGAGVATLAPFARAIEQNPPQSLLANLAGLPASLGRALASDLPALFAYHNLEGMPAATLVPNYVGGAVVLGGLALLLVYRGSAVLESIRHLPRRPAERPAVPLELALFVYLASYLPLYALHPFSGAEARYLVPLEPALTTLAALGLYEALRSSRAVALASALLLVAVANGSWEHARLMEDRDVLGLRGRRPAEAGALTRVLEGHGVRHVVSDDWDLFWRLSFASHGRIVGCHAVAEQRDWLEQPERHAARRFAVIVAPDSHRDRALGRRTQRLGIPVLRIEASGKAIHLIGPSDGSPEQPRDWCPPELRLEPVMSP